MDWKQKVDAISLGEFFAVLSGFIYITGYLIASLYVRSRGINQMSFISAQYIETGLVFVLLTALFIVVPVVIFNMALDSRRRHGYPNLLLALVFPFVTSNYLYVCTFLALFVTRYEWLLRTNVFGWDIGLRHCIAIYLAALFILQIAFMYFKYTGSNASHGLVPDLERAEERPILISPARRWLANIFMAASVAFTIWFDVLLYQYVGWLPEFMSRAAFYLYCILLIILFAFVISRVSHVYAESGRRWKFWFVAAPVFLALYYFAISTYEFGVYINIPMSRGGKYPITLTTLHFASESTHSKEGRASEQVYVIEETDDRYYVVPTTIANWFQDHPPVDGISKSEVAYPHYDHLRSGEPRINHLKKP